jgi:hypothetical protein
MGSDCSDCTPTSSGRRMLTLTHNAEFNAGVMFYQAGTQELLLFA